MGLLTTLGMAMGSSWVSGINLYAAILTLGLLSRFGHHPLPGDLQILTSWWVIGVAGFMYCVEFIADKIPWVDSIWTGIHTFIRVPAGAVLAAAAFGKFDPAIQIIAFMVGGGIALSSHGTKTVTRAALNISPEPFTNIAASLSEDALVVGSIFMTVFLPGVIIVVVSIALIAAFFIVPKTVKAIKSLYLKLFQRPETSLPNSGG